MGTGAGATVKGSAKMAAIDLENPNVHAEGWFVYVMPTQTGVQMMGSGRYGYWDKQPDVTTQDGWVIITGRDDPDGTQPIFVAPRENVHTVHVCQGDHIQALPFPVVEVPPEQPS